MPNDTTTFLVIILRQGHSSISPNKCTTRVPQLYILYKAQLYGCARAEMEAPRSAGSILYNKQQQLPRPRNVQHLASRDVQRTHRGESILACSNARAIEDYHTSWYHHHHPCDVALAGETPAYLSPRDREKEREIDAITARHRDTLNR